jgi:hypothetical protein
MNEARTCWEYRVEKNPQAVSSYLELVNALGAEGWEVFAVEAYQIHLKRCLVKKNAS